MSLYKFYRICRMQWYRLKIKWDDKKFSFFLIIKFSASGSMYSDVMNVVFWDVSVWLL
jgi:hypothetical protein